MARGAVSRLTRIGVLVAVFMAIAATPAAASVTLGQLSPGGPGGTCAVADFAQLSVASGNSYTVPGTGTITQWSHNANSGVGQSLTLKVLRKVADPNLWQVIGLDGPRPLTGGLLNAFTVSIPVQAGDILDLDAANGTTACLFTGLPQDTRLVRGTSPNLGLGDAGSFNQVSGGGRINVSAVFQPSNVVTVGAIAQNKKKGTATVSLTLPNPGDLTASGTGVSAASAGRASISKAVGAGPAQLQISATGKQKKKLRQKGKVTLNVAITYTPTNGDPATQTVAVKLVKKK